MTEIDPYAEALYRRKMGLLARLGRVKAARRTFKEVICRLDELGLDPDESRRQFVTDVVTTTSLSGSRRVQPSVELTHASIGFADDTLGHLRSLRFTRKLGI